MNIYKIEVKKILSRIVPVEAENEQEAVQKVEEMYKNEEIILDFDDFVTHEIIEYLE
ncbi:protein dpnD [Capnocytophaga canis]|uniref:Protein dpnD n=1 Tax=Capnocytophaga canis TaxID=1848903 RepID=A0A3A1YIQ4_9FLAO|nr:DpnD/PcfM family protein [Capnocytophaga canis]RIY38143.1 protein dpnD [Capnocytophaga canis]